MANSFHCPFCNSDFPIMSDTSSEHTVSFGPYASYSSLDNKLEYYPSAICISFYKCPKCDNFSIIAKGKGEYCKNLNVHLVPNSCAKQFPSYLPKVILQDYEEAYSILYLSPKASATLSRRCLQGMIRDFWGISKKRLIDEINSLQSVVSASQWNAIDSLRKIGNIGAHMESDINTIIDVDPDEAEKLLKLIELLIDKWYISRHDEEQLLSDITDIANNKETNNHKK